MGQLELPYTQRILTLNRAKCLKCGVVVASYLEHDYARCACANLLMYGGAHRPHVVAFDPESIEVMNEYRYG